MGNEKVYINCPCGYKGPIPEGIGKVCPQCGSGDEQFEVTGPPPSPTGPVVKVFYCKGKAPHYLDDGKVPTAEEFDRDYSLVWEGKAPRKVAGRAVLLGCS